MSPEAIIALLRKGDLPPNRLHLAGVIEKLFLAIKEHHDQRADDRCIEDDDKLYEVAGLGPCDRAVGSKEDMLANCKRFIDNRCTGGEWPSYADLEKRIARALESLRNGESKWSVSDAIKALEG